MRLLFAITVGCFCAVLWVALALARRIRLGQILIAKPKPVRLPATREFFEAGEFRTPRPLHLDQEIFQQKPRRPLADIRSAAEGSASVFPGPESSRPAPVTGRLLFPEPVPIRQESPYATLFGQSVSIAQIGSDHQTASANSPRHFPGNDTHAAASAPVSAPIDFASRRIPPRSDRGSGLRRRVDLSHFSSDMGDLTDPYTKSLRGSGTQGPAPSSKRPGYER